MTRGKVAKMILIGLGGIIVVAFIAYSAFMGLYAYTSTPQFCAKCHYVEPYVESWQNTAHKDVNCMQCHEPAGPLGKLHSKSRGLNYYLMDKTGDYSEIMIKASYISERSCFVCHIGKNEEHPNTVNLDRERFDHLESTKDDEGCLSCHRDVGHSTDIGVDNVIK